MKIENLYETFVFGDAFSFLKKLPNNSVDAIITDPLYDLDLEYRNKIHAEFLRVSRGVVIVFCPPENQWMLPADQYLFWVKPISTKNTSKSYSRFVEMILVYGRGEWNCKRHWSQYTNVFSDLVEDSIHPYRKPASMMTRLLLNHTKPGDVVLDCFAGSGVLANVCHTNDRHFICVEHDEDTFDALPHYLGESITETNITWII